MNILILGDSNSVFVRDFCKYVINRNDNVCIFSYTNTKKYSELYEELGIKEVYIRSYFVNNPIRLSRIIPLLYMLCKKTREIKGVLPFGMSIDVIHVHYVDPSLLIYLFAFWITAKRRILTFWGSDILRVPDRNKKVLIPFLNMASSIGFMIPAQQSFFCSIYGNKFIKKIKVIDFGNGLLDLIDSIRSPNSKNICKEKFGLDDEKVTIHVGYNKSEEQQHIKILEQICLLPSWIGERIQIAFPWGYGGNPSEDIYTGRIKDLLDKNRIEYIFFKDFMQGEKLAEFRMTCDIFVYGQTTDAMSDSCLEYIYSGSLFLCPGWLWENYSLVNNWTTQCVKYSDFTDLSDVLCGVLGEKEYRFSNHIEDGLREIIYKNKSWKNLSHQWRKGYE